MKQNLKPCAYNTRKGYEENLVLLSLTVCLLENEPASYGGWQGKALQARSRRETESEQGDESAVVDPKPGDLPMARVKRG